MKHDRSIDAGLLEQVEREDSIKLERSKEVRVTDKGFDMLMDSGTFDLMTVRLVRGP